MTIWSDVVRWSGGLRWSGGVRRRLRGVLTSFLFRRSSPVHLNGLGGRYLLLLLTASLLLYCHSFINTPTRRSQESVATSAELLGTVYALDYMRNEAVGIEMNDPPQLAGTTVAQSEIQLNQPGSLQNPSEIPEIPLDQAKSHVDQPGNGSTPLSTEPKAAEHSEIYNMSINSVVFSAHVKPLHTPRLSGIPYCTVPEVLPEPLETRRSEARAACSRLEKQLHKRWRKEVRRGPSSGSLSKLRWDPYHHLVYCPIFKAASTTWAWHLLRVKGVGGEEIINAHQYHNQTPTITPLHHHHHLPPTTPSLHALLRHHLPPPTRLDHEIGFLTLALKVVFTRHPYQRLVTTYRDFLEVSEEGGSEYSELRKSLLPNTTFPAFCRHILDTGERWLKDPKLQAPPDPHVMPMTFVCSPCGMQYDVYGKLETMASDAQFIATQCGLTQEIQPELKLPSHYNFNREFIMGIDIPNKLRQGLDNRVNMTSENEYGRESDSKMRMDSEKRISIVSEPKEIKFIKESEHQIALVSDNKITKESNPFLDRVTENENGVSKPRYQPVESDRNNMTANPSVKQNEISNDSEVSYTEYIQQLSSKDRKRLYKFYKYDFHIFGYTV